MVQEEDQRWFGARCADLHLTLPTPAERECVCLNMLVQGSGWHGPNIWPVLTASWWRLVNIELKWSLSVTLQPFMILLSSLRCEICTGGARLELAKIANPNPAKSFPSLWRKHSNSQQHVDCEVAPGSPGLCGCHVCVYWWGFSPTNTFQNGSLA